MTLTLYVHSISIQGGVSETLEAVEVFVLSRTKKLKDGRFSRIAHLWKWANSVYSAEDIKASLNELDNKMQLHLQVLIAAQGQTQIRRQVEMAETLKNLSASMFAFSMSIPTQSHPAVLTATPTPAGSDVRRRQRHDSEARPQTELRASDSDFYSGRPVTSTRPSETGMRRSTGPKRYHGRAHQAAQSPSGVSAGDAPGCPPVESDAGVDSEEVDAIEPERLPLHADPSAGSSSNTTLLPLLSSDSHQSSDENAELDDADLVTLLKLRDRPVVFNGVNEYLEIAAHQFIFGSFVCACAMLCPRFEGLVFASGRLSFAVQ